MKNLFLHIIALSVISLSGCSKIDLAGVYATKYRDVPAAFSGIEIHGSMDVAMSDEVSAAEITADSNVLPYIEIEVKDNVLHIRYSENAKFSSDVLGTVITVPCSGNLSSIRISDGAFLNVGCRLDRSVKIESRSGSGLYCDRISSDDLTLSLYDGSSFSAGHVGISSASLVMTGGASVRMDGTISYCKAIFEDGSSLGPKYDEAGLQIGDFDCNMRDGSSAVFASDGTISGIMRDGSSISCITGRNVDYSSLVVYGHSVISVHTRP